MSWVFRDANTELFCYKCMILHKQHNNGFRFLMQPSEKFRKNLLVAAVRQFPKGHLAAASTLVATLCMALALFPSENAEATRQVNTYVELKPTSTSAPITQMIDATLANTPFALARPGDIYADAEQHQEVSEAVPEGNTLEFTVKSGDNLSLIFQRAGLKDRDLYELFSSTPESKESRRMMPGEIIVVRLSEEDKVEALTYIQNELT